jgi:hypothetical protein
LRSIGQSHAGHRPPDCLALMSVPQHQKRQARFFFSLSLLSLGPRVIRRPVLLSFPAGLTPCCLLSNGGGGRSSGRIAPDMHHGGHSLHESCACTIGHAAKQGSGKRFRVSKNDVCCARDAARHRADCYSPIGPLALQLLKSRLDGHKTTGRRRTNHAALCALVRCFCRSAIHTRFVTSDWRVWLAAQMRREDILRRWRPRPVSRDSDEP